jgi:CheY-like chemotaxis protein
MTNEAISAMLDYFYDEAALGAGTQSADHLLRSIDDVRDLLSRTPAPPVAMKEFDLVERVAEIVEVLNLASGKRARQMVMDAPETLVVTQDERLVDQGITRVLDMALKLREENDTPLCLKISREGKRVLLEIAGCGERLATRISGWMNADPERALLQDPGDLPYGVALMVGGKRLRALGGSANAMRDSAGHAVVAFDFPLRAAAAERDDWNQNVRPGALDVLVAEDNDESFALSEMVLEDERVWRAKDGQEALRMIQQQRFDVVFMDVHMPGMSGYEAIRSMRDWETRTGNARTPIVVLSSDDVETQQRSAAEFGCSGFLRKPLQRWDLMPLLERLK